jgi:hypothetical protein
MVFLSFKGGGRKNQRNHYEKRKNLGFLEDDEIQIWMSCLTDYEKSGAFYFNAVL